MLIKRKKYNYMPDIYLYFKYFKFVINQSNSQGVQIRLSTILKNNVECYQIYFYTCDTREL